MFGNLGVGFGRLGKPALSEGGGFSLSAFMASQADGLFFDFTKTDRHFQEHTGYTLADDVGEVIGLALDQRTWGVKTLAQIVAEATDLIVNGGFDADASWTKGTGWSIGSGVATKSAGTGSTLEASGSPASVANRLYRFDYTITRTAGSVVPRIGATLGFSRTASGTYSEYILAPDTSKPGFFGDASFAGTVDNVSVKLIPGNPGLQSSGTLKGIRQTTGDKFDGSDDNNLTPYLAASGANFIFAKTTVPASLGATQVIAGASGAAANRVFLGINTSGYACGGVGSDSTTTIVGTTDLRSTEADIALTFDGSTVRLIVNGVVEYEAAQNSTPTTTIPFRVGALNNNGTAGSFYGGAAKALLAGREYLTVNRFNQISNSLPA